MTPEQIRAAVLALWRGEEIRILDPNAVAVIAVVAMMPQAKR